MTIESAAALLSPVFNSLIYTTNNGAPLSLGTITTYGAGGFTFLLNTYNNFNRLVPNANPMTLDENGVQPHPLWLIPNQVYNMVLRDSIGNIICSIDNIVVTAPTGHEDS